MSETKTTVTAHLDATEIQSIFDQLDSANNELSKLEGLLQGIALLSQPDPKWQTAEDQAMCSIAWTGMDLAEKINAHLNQCFALIRRNS